MLKRSWMLLVIVLLFLLVGCTKVHEIEKPMISIKSFDIACYQDLHIDGYRYEVKSKIINDGGAGYAKIVYSVSYKNVTPNYKWAYEKEIYLTEKSVYPCEDNVRIATDQINGIKCEVYMLDGENWVLADEAIHEGAY